MAKIDELKVGQSATYERTVTETDIAQFAELSGDHNPVHLDEAFAAKTLFKGRIAHGMLSAAFISTTVGTKLPGYGSIYVSQNLRFRAPVRIGDTEFPDGPPSYGSITTASITPPSVQSPTLQHGSVARQRAAKFLRTSEPMVRSSSLLKRPASATWNSRGLPNP